MSSIQTEPVLPTIRYQQFTVPMAKGLWNDRKTQTRRKFRGLEELRPGQWHIPGGLVGVRTADVPTAALDYTPMQKGDLVCVREPWRVSKRMDAFAPVKGKTDLHPVLKKRGMSVFYEAGGICANFDISDEERNRIMHFKSWEGVFPETVWRFDPWIYAKQPDWVGKYRQAMHMPRWASRMTLEITDVRVERLLDITAEDARAEGVEMESADPPFWYVPGISTSEVAVGIEDGHFRHEERCYLKLWDWINGQGASQMNPWVIAYSFTVHKQNVDDMLELRCK